MAFTAFGGLTPIQKTNWSRVVWKAARDQMFLKNFMSDTGNSVVHRITELTETARGTKCLFQLVSDLTGDGVRGDDEREGNEEAMDAHSQIIQTDLLSHGTSNKGRHDDQKNIINFRQTGKDKLSDWLAQRTDELAFLTMSGISYAFQNNGAPRVGSVFPDLEFAADVTAPSAKRSLMWTGTSLDASNTASITSAFVPKYNMIVDAIAYAKEHRIKPLMSGGKPYFVMFVAPGTLAALKKDEAYRQAVVAVATHSGMNSPWFTGATVTVDGAVIHEFNKVYNTKGAANGSKWGSGGLVNGTRTLLCGAQALAFADIGEGHWVEKLFNYESRIGLNIDREIGFKKPVFPSIYDGTDEDFGLLTIDHYLQ